MSSNSTNTEKVHEECIECGLCMQECVLMTKVNKQPKEISESLIKNPRDQRNLVYSCFQCGLCNLVCALGIKPKDMFLEARRRLVDEGVAPFKSHIFSMTDKKWNVYTLYRENYVIDYSDLTKASCDTVFFPGCNMATFAPKLTREVFRRVISLAPSTGILVECCQKPIHDLGLQKRFEDAVNRLNEKLRNLGAKRIITACPQCYYSLKDYLDKMEVLSVYDVLKETYLVPDPGKTLTVHDSCPDRENHVFGSKVRNLLREYRVVEMEHSKENSICCGAGGLVSAVDPELALSLRKKRLEEAKAVNADTLIVYCVTCANMLRAQPSNIRISHILNMVLKVDEDYSQIQPNLQKLFTGPKAKENMLKLTTQT